MSRAAGPICNQQRTSTVDYPAVVLAVLGRVEHLGPIRPFWSLDRLQLQ